MADPPRTALLSICATTVGLANKVFLVSGHQESGLRELSQWATASRDKRTNCGHSPCYAMREPQVSMKRRLLPLGIAFAASALNLHAFDTGFAVPDSGSTSILLGVVLVGMALVGGWLIKRKR